MLGGPARECDAQQTTNGQHPMPGEYRANSGPARLVPGPELSNLWVGVRAGAKESIRKILNRNTSATQFHCHESAY